MNVELNAFGRVLSAQNQWLEMSGSTICFSFYSASKSSFIFDIDQYDHNDSRQQRICECSLTTIANNSVLHDFFFGICAKVQ